MKKFNPEIHNRHSIRLKGYDYSHSGMYFVTINAHCRGVTRNAHTMFPFGEIINGKMILNEYGQIAHDEWIKTAELRSNVELDAFVVMPNHVHGIVVITRPVRALRATPLHDTRPYSRTINKNENMSNISPKSGELGTIVRAYKSATTKHINEVRNTPCEKMWQRNYFENIIRNEQMYQYIANYIVNNPTNWENDRFYIK